MNKTIAPNVLGDLDEVLQLRNAEVWRLPLTTLHQHYSEYPNYQEIEAENPASPLAQFVNILLSDDWPSSLIEQARALADAPCFEWQAKIPNTTIRWQGILEPIEAFVQRTTSGGFTPLFYFYQPALPLLELQLLGLQYRLNAVETPSQSR